MRIRWQLGVYLFNYLFIYWSSRVGVFLLCYLSISPYTCRDDINAIAICHLWRFILSDRYISRPSEASSCHFDGLSYSSHSNLLRPVHSQWFGGSLTEGMSLLSYCLHFHFNLRKCPCSRRRPTVPKFLSIIIIIIIMCIIIFKCILHTFFFKICELAYYFAVIATKDVVTCTWFTG